MARFFTADFVLMNATVRGPYVSPYVRDTISWHKYFTRRFDEAPNLALVGTAMTCEVVPHIQSYFLVVDQRALAIARDLWECPTFDPRVNNDDRIAYVRKNEIGFGETLAKRDSRFALLLVCSMSGTERGSSMGLVRFFWGFWLCFFFFFFLVGFRFFVFCFFLGFLILGLFIMINFFL